jgi:hypothetical protein
MRIYDGEFTVGSILDECRLQPRDSTLPRNKGSDEVDLKKLGSIVNRIPVDTVRLRRQRLNTFYEEVLVSADPDRGISFSGCLMILAHYNVINDSQSLRFAVVPSIPSYQVLYRLTYLVDWKNFYDAGRDFNALRRLFGEIQLLASLIHFTGIGNFVAGWILGNLVV